MASNCPRTPSRSRIPDRVDRGLVARDAQAEARSLERGERRRRARERSASGRLRPGRKPSEKPPRPPTARVRPRTSSIRCARPRPTRPRTSAVVMRGESERGASGVDRGGDSLVAVDERPVEIENDPSHARRADLAALRPTVPLVAGGEAPADPAKRLGVSLQVEPPLVAAQAAVGGAESRADRAVVRRIPDAIADAEEIVVDGAAAGGSVVSGASSASSASSGGSNVCMVVEVPFRAREARRVYYPRRRRISCGRITSESQEPRGSSDSASSRAVAEHPWFRLAAVGASGARQRSAYGDATRWMLPEPDPRLGRRR